MSRKGLASQSEQRCVESPSPPSLRFSKRSSEGARRLVAKCSWLVRGVGMNFPIHLGPRSGVRLPRQHSKKRAQGIGLVDAKPLLNKRRPCGVTNSQGTSLSRRLRDDLRIVRLSRVRCLNECKTGLLVFDWRSLPRKRMSLDRKSRETSMVIGCGNLMVAEGTRSNMTGHRWSFRRKSVKHWLCTLLGCGSLPRERRQWM